MNLPYYFVIIGQTLSTFFISKNNKNPQLFAVSKKCEASRQSIRVYPETADSHGTIRKNASYQLICLVIIRNKNVTQDTCELSHKMCFPIYFFFTFYHNFSYQWTRIFSILSIQFLNIIKVQFSFFIGYSKSLSLPDYKFYSYPQFTGCI